MGAPARRRAGLGRRRCADRRLITSETARRSANCGRAQIVNTTTAKLLKRPAGSNKQHRRYAFVNEINVIDLGLRLIDVEKWGLEREAVQYRESAEIVREGLRRDGATDAEINFLATHRVELNAFASDELVRWITTKLETHGVQKVIPEGEVLAEDYRRQFQSAYLGQHFGELLERSREHLNCIEMPRDLPEQVARRLQERPSLAWNDAVAEIARMQISPEWGGYGDEV